MAKKKSKLSQSNFEDIQTLFKGQSPRAKILIIGSAIDEQLKKILQMHLVSSREDDDLLDQYRPLGEFKSRIELAERLGIISAQLAGDIHLIRKLRNDCAHSLQDFNFEKGGTRDRVNLLYRSLGSRVKAYFFKAEEPVTFEKKFEFVAFVHLHYLEDLTSEVALLKPANVEPLLYKDSKEEDRSPNN